MRVPQSIKQALQVSGQWPKFVSLRDKLKREGHSPDQAYKQALSQCQQAAPVQGEPVAAAGEAQAEFPPRYQVREEDLPRFVGREVFANKKPCSMLDNVMWALDHLALQGVRPEDAPSCGAWALLVNIRDDSTLRNKFLTEVIGRLLPSKQQIETANNLQDDGRRQLTFIENLLAEAGEADPKQAAQ